MVCSRIGWLRLVRRDSALRKEYKRKEYKRKGWHKGVVVPMQRESVLLDYTDRDLKCMLRRNTFCQNGKFAVRRLRRTLTV